MKNFDVNTALIWGLSILLALVFAAAGISKLLGVEQVMLPFERMGMPAFAKVTGLLEIAGALGLFVPRVRFWAALGLSATMIGAIAYHLLLDPQQAVLPAIILFVLTALVAWWRRPV